MSKTTTRTEGEAYGDEDEGKYDDEDEKGAGDGSPDQQLLRREELQERGGKHQGHAGTALAEAPVEVVEAQHRACGQRHEHEDETVHDAATTTTTTTINQATTETPTATTTETTKTPPKCL